MCASPCTRAPRLVGRTSTLLHYPQLVACSGPYQGRRNACALLQDLQHGAVDRYVSCMCPGHHGHCSKPKQVNLAL